MMGIDFLPLLLVLAIAGIVIVGLGSLIGGIVDGLRGGTQTICTRCGSTDGARSRTGGSILIEIVLWIAFIVPGIIYSLWRLTSRHRVCRACGAAELVPVESPMGQDLLRRFHGG